jgi:GNAT superfamily N-acetyltransferase
MGPENVEIGYLLDHLDFIPQLAEWQHAEWSYLRPGDTVEKRAARIRTACNYSAIPTVFVAFQESALLGSAMLVTHDMDTRTDLSPWLAGVYVSRDHRGRGIGKALVERVVIEVRSLGVPLLYLYTPSAAQFYSGLGWRIFEVTAYRGCEVTIMSYQLK